MFVGRERELKKLNLMYQSNQFEFAVLYGRRRVGKTTLIREFMKEKPGVYYISVEGTKRENISGLSKALLSNGDLKHGIAEFHDFEALLSYIDSIALSGERMVIAIDEYPYLAVSYPAISSLIQSHIDRCWKDSRLFLILCGSSMSFMEEQVLGYKSPLYGRRTAQFKIHPFTFFEARRMLANFEPEQQAVLYGVTGGIPEYLSRINQQLDMDENIVQLFFDESGRLFEEPINLMKQELREPMTYHSIISAIASGASKLNEIATKTGLETSGCSNQLSSLIALEIVCRETPITEPDTSRKTLYKLTDSMYLFWYRFVRPNSSSIIRGVGQQIYDTVVRPQLSDFMGAVFEEICKQYLFLPQVYSKLPFPIGEIGRWWGNNPKLRCQEEIDIMSVMGKKALFCECKWRNDKVELSVVDKLIERGELFSYHDKYYCIFSKSGFSNEALSATEDDDNLALIDFDSMLKVE
ncbi:MAG: ATP-binding protein [Lachnospiraceae bacterium]|nr:ATP-binding protein [Lachnospiraceae bacterium]